MSDNAATVQAWAAIAGLCVTVILATLTFVYVRLTKRMADQMVRQAEPVVLGRIEPLYQLYVKYVITNVGLGPALDVELDLSLTPGRRVTWRHPLLEPGRSEIFLVPNPEGSGSDRDALSDLAARDAVLTSHIKYIDRGGRPYERRGEVRFKELLANWGAVHWQLPSSEVERLGDVLKKAIAELTNSVKHLGTT